MITRISHLFTRVCIVFVTKKEASFFYLLNKQFIFFTHTLVDEVFPQVVLGMFGKNFKSCWRLTIERETSPPFKRK